MSTWKKQAKAWMSKFILRIIHTWKIWFGRRRSYMVISMTRKDMTNMFMSKPYQVELSMHAMRNYVAVRIIKDYAEQYSEEDMICMRAELEADVILNEE